MSLFQIVELGRPPEERQQVRQARARPLLQLAREALERIAALYAIEDEIRGV